MTEPEAPRPAPGDVHTEPAPHLLELADHIASVLHQAPGRQIEPAQLLGIAKEANGGMLASLECHNLIGLVAIHPNVEPLEDGRFTFREDTEFEPRSEAFEAEAAREAGSSGNGGPLNPRQVARILYQMSTDPRAVRARADRRRIANTRHRARPPKRGGAKKPVNARLGKAGAPGPRAGRKSIVKSLVVFEAA